MHGTLSCPICGTTGIALASPSCPHCAVGFTSPVMTPAMYASAPAPAHVVATNAVGPASTPADSWSPPMYAPADAEGAPPAPAFASAAYGSIWRRMFAAIIDYAIVGIPFLLVLGPTEYFGFNHESADSFSSVFYTHSWESLEMAAFLVYVAVMQSSSKQATFGMQALDLRLVHEDDHGQVSFARAAGRDLLSYLSGLILLIGYLMIAFTTKRQGLHDKLARTVVLHDRSR